MNAGFRARSLTSLKNIRLIAPFMTGVTLNRLTVTAILDFNPYEK